MLCYQSSLKALGISLTLFQDIFNWGNPPLLLWRSLRVIWLSIYEPWQIRKLEAASARAANSCQQQAAGNPQAAVLEVLKVYGAFQQQSLSLLDPQSQLDCLSDSVTPLYWGPSSINGSKESLSDLQKHLKSILWYLFKMYHFKNKSGGQMGARQWVSGFLNPY